MVFESPGSIFLSIGPIVIRWYGVMIALGFAAACYLAIGIANRWKLDKENVVNTIFVSFLGGILGARLYFVALNWTTFSAHPEQILATWLGGLSIHGGFIGALICAYLYTRAVKLPFLSCLDLAAMVVPLAQAIGRWGNFFNSECFGGPVPADFPLRLYIAPAFRPIEYQESDFFHPAFLYESLWDLAIFALLYFFLGERLKRYPGITFFIYLSLYSVGRLLIEPLRTDSIIRGGIQVPIVASIVTLVISLVVIGVLSVRYKSAAK